MSTNCIDIKNDKYVIGANTPKNLSLAKRLVRKANRILNNKHVKLVVEVTGLLIILSVIILEPIVDVGFSFFFTTPTVEELRTVHSIILGMLHTLRSASIGVITLKVSGAIVKKLNRNIEG